MRCARLRALGFFALTSVLLTSSASAQAPVVVQPAPTMHAPVLVVPGQPPGVTVQVTGAPEGAVVCPPEPPCPPPCPPGFVCPAPACPCVAPTVMVSGTAQTVASPLIVTQPVAEVAPSQPAPGTFAIGYLGTYDGTDVLHGGALRFTGHLTEVWFLELILGGQGAATSFRDIGEGVFLIGPRVAAPIVTPNLRLYASLDTGVIIRSIGNMQTWGIWPISLGGGLELGGALDELWSIGGYVDVRAEARVPFEREPASIGVVWSAGLALLWF